MVFMFVPASTRTKALVAHRFSLHVSNVGGGRLTPGPGVAHGVPLNWLNISGFHWGYFVPINEVVGPYDW